jgi:hypothetical protein
MCDIILRGARDLGQPPRQADEIAARKYASAVVDLRSPIRRIEIEQRRRGIVALDEFGPRQTFNHDAGETLVDLIQQRAKLGDIEPGRSVAVDTEIAAGDLAAKR